MIPEQPGVLPGRRRERQGYAKNSYFTFITAVLFSML